MSYVSESDQTPIIFYYFNGQSDTIATEEFFFLENTVFVLLIKLSALENFFFHELHYFDPQFLSFLRIKY